METIYTDKEVLADALAAEKASTSVYNLVSNECVHNELRGVMLDLLGKEHDIQNEVFQTMHEKGLYPTPSAEQKKVEEAKSKFSCGVKMN